MRFVRFIGSAVRNVIYLLIAVVMLVTGIVLALYSDWAQNLIRQHLVAKLNSYPDTSVTLDRLKISFPLNLDIAGVSVVQSGDTMLRADTLTARVAVLPLLGGNVDLSHARLVNGAYRIGNTDSLMCLKIRAGELLVEPASVNISNMHINIDDAMIRHGLVDMTLKQDTAASDTATASQTMRIQLKKLRVEDLTYRMSMLPTIDSLGTNIPRGTLSDGIIDLESQQIKLRTFIADSLSVAYIAPDSATIAAYPPVPVADDEPASAPWTITIDTIRIDGGEALYTTRGVVPAPGLDFAYIQASDMDLTVTDFYNRTTAISLPLRLHATERCGITLDATGTFAMDSTAMYFRDFNVYTPLTYLNADGLMGVGDLMTDPNLPLELNANGYLGFGDLKMMFPDYAAYLSMFAADTRANATIGLGGTSSDLSVSTLALSLPGRLSLNADGSLHNVFDPARIGCDVNLSGHIYDVKSIVKAMTAPDLGLVVPPMTLKGHFKMHDGNMAGKLAATTYKGRIALDAKFNGNNDGYALDLAADRFPVNAFMPDLGVGAVTASVDVKGTGLDVFSPKTDIDGTAHIASLDYLGFDYKGININMGLHNGDASLTGGINNEDLSVSIDAHGNLTGDTYDWTAKIDGDIPDMQSLKLSETPLAIAAQLKAEATYTPKTNDIQADIYLPQLSYKGDENNEFVINDVSAKIQANDTMMHVGLHNRDLVANATARTGIKTMSADMDTLMLFVDRQIRARKVNVDTLQMLLPHFDITVTAGDDNMINDILAPQKMGIGHLMLTAVNDSALSMHSSVLGFTNGDMTLDTIRLNIAQDGPKMNILGNIDNRKGNMDAWAHISANGQLNTDRLSLRLIQQNAAGETGFDLGAITMLRDSVITARLFPLSPVVGYKKWTVNLDNFVSYNYATHHIDANLKMKGDDSSLRLYTDHKHTDGEHEHNDSINNVILQIDDIKLADWIAFNPFAPPIAGNLSANIDLQWDGGSNINGDGTVKLDDFYYDNRRVSSLQLDLDVATNLSGTVRAQADMLVDGVKTITLAGNLNDEESTSPFNLDLSVIRFPLATVNPFLPEDMAQLRGTLNGSMTVSGNSEHPLINGEISFDSAAIKMAMTNTAYTLSDVKIPVINNIVSFNDFNILGANDNPLYINGSVDLSSMVSPKIDLKMRARNMMVVNTQKAARNAIIFGKGYLNLDASAKGNMRFMAVNADVTVLSGTNVTYVMTESAADLTAAANEGMVKFVNLTDTAAVLAADSLVTDEMLMMIDAQLNIQTGTTITVDLPTGTRDKVQIQPSGYLTYTQSPVSDGRMTGRIDLNSGMARYTLPIIGAEKVFNLNSGSYVAFNGDMLNPVLNIQATDPVKVSVTQEGQNSRLVNFDIHLGVTGTLEQMDVKFDLTTDDDLTVANELQSMSAEQRANQAMNMLLYNMYTGPGSTNNASMLSANPLFSFLESQINNWAANNIKGVDLTFGIDQYNQTVNGTTSAAMTYSYQVSKSLFDDRFKIVVGGNYSTDSNADENLAENLINDISFEYFLNPQQTMVLRVFRHVGYVSILEGEVTQTGVGFVYRRKLDRLANMIPKFIRPKEKPIVPPAARK